MHGRLRSSAVSAYVAVARQTFRRQSTYRAATAAGVFTNTIFGIVLAEVVVAAFRGRDLINGITAGEAVTMTFFAQGMLMVTRTFGWHEVTDRVRTGQIASDLQRPLDVGWYWAAVFLGAGLFSAVTRGIPPFLVGGLLYHLTTPSTVGGWAGSIVVMVGAAAVASRWWFLVSLPAFWLHGDTRGVVQLASAVQNVASGSLLPLQFFPDGLAAVFRHSPFAAMTQLPAEVFLGRQSVWAVAAVQLAWFAVLHGLGTLVWRACARKLVIDGG